MNRSGQLAGLSLPACGSLLLLLSPNPALAGNGAHPRTPVEWSGAPCMTVIDRSQGAVYPLSYSIPFEDTEVTTDEVDGSRTHQFFVYCRDRHLEDILPGWITQLDVDAAGAKGLGDPSIVDPDIDILDSAIDWTSCWARITNDDQRRPITFAAAAEPIMWDTSMLATGTYVLDGYTFEPWYNLWSPHPGVFKIVDDPAPAANGPAAALSFGEQIVITGHDASITGCVDAMDGATMSLSWSNGNINGEPNWQVFAADMPVASGSFDIGFTAPIEAAGNTVMVRLDISDPMGREWTAYSRAYISVVEDVGGDTCDSGGGFVGDPCGTDTDTGTGTDNSSSGSGETGPGIGGSGEGCSCASEPARTSPALLLGVVALASIGLGLGRRRRRRPRR